jgi:predicted DNA-binding transcriptional regulator AlpA
MTIFLELDGRPTPLTEVSEKTGIHRATLYWRFKQGWKPPKLLQISG